jgi:hypothetical protein
MARPKKQVVDYFPHSCTSGKTIYILEQEYGNDGYAFWFKLLELLGTTPGHCVDYTDIGIKRFISAKARVSAEKIELMLQLLAELNAIDLNLWQKGQIWSQNFVNNIYIDGGLRRSEIPQKPSLCNINSYNEELLQQKPQTDAIITDLIPQRKEKEIESKINTAVSPVSPAVKKKRANKKDPNAEPYWKTLVAVYYSFCFEKFDEKPSFKGSDPSDMHRIIEVLKKRAAEKNVEWTEETAKLRWREYLGRAYQDDWLSKNWLLSNLNRKMDTVFFNVKNSKNGISQQQPESIGKTFTPD